MFNGEVVARPDNGERFDLVVMWAVLPHVWNPVATIEYVERVLATEGKVIVCCCNIESYAAKINERQMGPLGFASPLLPLDPDDTETII